MSSSYPLAPVPRANRPRDPSPAAPTTSTDPSPLPPTAPRQKDPLDTATPDDILLLAKWYFLLGCAFLPFLWLVNFAHLYKVSVRRKAELSPSVATYLWMSLFGCLAWTIGIFTWLGLYQVNRTKWGAFGDAISINLPLGA
ncbi:hypothetical protein HDU98_001525 [Podochytrium sp. JEL0797]|nr:hypothetical protein HDU98_001525 [Podochytrium sp. JEL0797]